MTRGSRRRRGWWVVVVWCLWMVVPPVWAQDENPRVAVLPFTIHSQQDLRSTQKSVEEVLVRQLRAEGVRTVDPQEVERVAGRGAVQTDEQARSLGTRLQADYVLVGSFNQIGNSISLDARLVDVSGRKRTGASFAEDQGMENLAAAAKKVIQPMTAQLLSRAVIADIAVRGNERIEAEAIKLNVKSKKGEVLNPEQVREDIRAVYAMGSFEKVDAEVTDAPAGKVLTFVVQENPTVQEVRITGNKKISEKDILAAIATRPYTILQRNVVSEDVQKILKLYQQKGYFNTEVTPTIEFPKDPRRAVVTFPIKENQKIYIEKITFVGNKRVSNRKLRGIMQTKQKGILSWITDRGILQRDILEADVDRLTVFYHDEGYMDAKVGTPQVTHQEDGIHIEVPIEEGERYRVSDVQVTGDRIDKQEEVVEKLESKPSNYFSREDLRKDIDQLSKAYMDEGYAHTEVDPQVKRDQEDRTASITYDIEKKEKVRIGRIYISGNTKTRDKVIRRELLLAEGDTFSASRLERSIMNLRKLDYFEEVEITPSESGQSDIMNLNVKVKEKLTGSISVGGGFSSDDGLFTSGEIMQRNLFGRGQTLALKGYLGAEAQRYVVSFTEPWLFDRRLAAGIDLFNWLREYNDFTKDSTGFRLRTAYPFGSYSRMNVYYTLEDADVTEVDDDASEFIKDQEGRFFKSSVTLGFERDSTDHPFLPTKGSLNTINLEYSSKYLGSDSDFLKAEINSGWYFPLFWKFVGFVRGGVGWIEEMDEDNPIPIYERFFMGGINSLRGFEWGDVGPRTREGDIIGGVKYGLVNVELLFPLWEKLGVRGVVFFDAGNAYRESEDIDLTDFRTDAGAGLRWNSPMGPLRLEWGYNIDPEPGEDDYQWQFSAGAFF